MASKTIKSCPRGKNSNRCDVSERVIKRWQKATPVVHVGDGKFVSSKSPQGKKIIKKLVCSSREQRKSRRMDRRVKKNG